MIRVDGRVGAVFTGHDAGHYSLPDSVIRSRAGYRAILEAEAASRKVQLGEDPAVMQQRAVEAIFEAAKAGEPLFDERKPTKWTADDPDDRGDEARVDGPGGPVLPPGCVVRGGRVVSEFRT